MCFQQAIPHTPGTWGSTGAVACPMTCIWFRLPIAPRRSSIGFLYTHFHVASWSRCCKLDISSCISSVLGTFRFGKLPHYMKISSGSECRLSMLGSHCTSACARCMSLQLVRNWLGSCSLSSSCRFNSVKYSCKGSCHSRKSSVLTWPLTNSLNSRFLLRETSSDLSPNSIHLTVAMTSIQHVTDGAGDRYSEL